MSQMPLSNQPSPNKIKNKILLSWIFFGIILLLALAIVIIVAASLGAGSSLTLDRLLGLSTSQVTWNVTRAAGWVAYLLLWLSTVLGLAVSSKFLDNILHRTYTFDFHEYISLLALGFVGLHIIVLLADQYMPFKFAQLIIPFLSPYRRAWVGLGVIGMYLSLLVTVTYYIRRRIGLKTFRVIHFSSLIGYLGVTLHGFFTGTDTSLPVSIFLYISTFLITIALTIYWLLAPKLSPDFLEHAPEKVDHPEG